MYILSLLFVICCIDLKNTVRADCYYPLLNEARITATSQASVDRGPSRARLDGQGAWTAGNSDISQALIIDLGTKKNITAISTQGRAFTSEFVIEYKIEYGSNGLDYAEYKDTEGNVKLFRGNVDGNKVQRNKFDIPIIAQWIRINPTRWRDRISLRVEVYGCSYVASTITFDGEGFVKRDLRLRNIMSTKDHIRMRFKTNQANGILLYSRGTQGDYLAFQLRENQLVLNLELGSKMMTSISVGSLLDDNLWHDVTFVRNMYNIILTVDRVVVRHRVRGEFYQLDLNREMYVGGTSNYNQDGLVVSQNFTGCIENLYINYTNLIEELRELRNDYYSEFQSVGVLFSCRDEQIIPITFKTQDSHLTLKGYDNVISMNISLDFRTFDDKGLLIYHKFTTAGYVKLTLEKARVQLELTGERIPKVYIEPFDEMYNDGRWHRVTLVMAENYIQIDIDGRPSKTVRLVSFRTSGLYVVGGGVYGSSGFVGCMRNINVDGNYITPTNLQKHQFEGEIVFDACQMIDRCNPNPCEHGSTCTQNWDEFFCRCAKKFGQESYTGAVCHTSIHPLSCEAFAHANPGAKTEDILIDVDGSGELDPFPVTCKIEVDGQTETVLRHKNEQQTTVDGFEKPGSFAQEIMYNANIDQINELVNRSHSCSQYLKYECRRARLLNTPSPEGTPFRPYSWWVGRTNQIMDFWAGGLPGSRKCYCALKSECIDRTKWCNCDAFQDEWQSDEGFINYKDYLPVRQLRFGDTGTALDNKQGKYSLGPLVCQGDYIFENVVTFRFLDATLNFPTFDMGHSGDIYFEFRMTVANGVFIHSVGPTDFIKISILGGDQIQFSYDAGNSPLTVSVEVANKLNDNNWHSVLVERNRKEARVVVDGTHRSEVREPVGRMRAIYLTSDLIVGATVDFREGFVGCMRALMLNGRPMDMMTQVQHGVYGMTPGCVGKCDSSPCLNNGTCLEGYNGYTCDCRWTSFKGPICADEIGANMRSEYYIKYEFEGTYKSTIAEKIRVAFTTTEPKGMLMGLTSYSGEFFNLMISNSGKLRLVFDFGFERQEVFSEQNLANGQHHDVRISRANNGLSLILQIDDYEPRVWKFEIGDSQDSQFNNLHYMYIGRNETMNQGDGFVGCISRVEFDDVYALNLLFQEDRPKNIRPYPEDIQQDFCGIEPTTYPPPEVETRPTLHFGWDSMHRDPSDSADSAVLGGVLAVIILALIIMAILIGRYVSRHKGEYRTHEDKGSKNAPDADTAVIHGETGHGVSKKKEWFI